MDNRARLAMEANRRYVQDRLDRRKVEGELDAFEAAMIQRCNERYDAAYWQSIAERDRENCRNRIVARAEEREKVKNTRKDITLACLIFFVFAAVMFKLAAWTPLPWWVSLILVSFGVLFLVSYIKDPCEFPTD